MRLTKRTGRPEWPEVIAIIFLWLLILAFSFFATTWLVMICAGIVGHISNNIWLMHLSFWKCAPVWMFLTLIKSVL